MPVAESRTAAVGLISVTAGAPSKKTGQFWYDRRQKTDRLSASIDAAAVRWSPDLR
jgi:hypothetical protein